MEKRLFPCVVLMTLLLFMAASSQAITLGVDPVSLTVPAGSPADVALVISGLGVGGAPSLSTFDLDISFNPSILAFNSASFGDPILGDQLDLFGLGGIQSVTPGVGTVNLVELSLDLPEDLNDLQADSFTLAILTFGTLTGGTSPLSLSINALGDAWGDPLAVDEIRNGSITATAPIPEPATLLLFASGLVGMGYLRGRRFFHF